MEITGMYLSSSNSGNEIEIVVEDVRGERTLGLLITDEGIVTIYDRTIGDDILARSNVTDLIGYLVR